MSAAAKPIRLKRGFWHVRFWEFLYLMIVGSMLATSVMLAGKSLASSAQTAMLISMLVFSIKLDTARRPPAERPYPSEFRWPCVGFFASSAVDIWKMDVQVGAGIHILSAIFGFIGAAALTFLEVFSWRKAHGTRRDQPPTASV